MKEVLKLIKEERESIENLMAENQETASMKELRLMHNKLSKLSEVEGKIKEYQAVK